MQKVLLVEDEKGLIMTLSDRLKSEGFDVSVAEDGEVGFEKARADSFDLLILDVMLPKKNGLDICRDLRAEGLETPILMLTAKGETVDRVLGLKLGADDYLPKPFEMMELLARIEALLRRSSKLSKSSGSDQFEFGEIWIDFALAQVKRADKTIELSAMEFKLLQHLVENQEQVHSRDQLLDAVWGYDAMPTTRTVDVHIAWLRQKLEISAKRPKHIQTVHGFGYKFVP